MIFYYAITNYHILNCILHKLKYNNNKKAVLYISKWHPEHLILEKSIKKTKFFDKVCIFEEVVFPSGNNKIGIKKIKNDIEYINKKISEKNKINFGKFEEINICGDDYGLSVYLNCNCIKYNSFEEGCGVFSNSDLLLNNIKRIDYSRYQILNYLKLPGNSKYVLNRYGDLNAQLPNYYNKKDIHFSVKEELEKIDNTILKKMISVFDDSFIVEDFSNYDIILTFHYINLGVFSVDEQRLFYSYLLDFFGHDKVVIKPHPSDIQGKYEEWFPNLKILPRKLPSEFLPSLVNNNFNSAITGWSTSINGLRDKVNRIVSFDQQIDYKYKIMIKYYMISQLIVSLLNEDYTIICYNFNINYISSFIDCFGNSNYQFCYCSNFEEISSISGKKVIIFDKVTSEQLETINNFGDDTVIFELEDINDTILENNNLVFGVIEKCIADSSKYVNSSVLKYDSFSCIVNDSILKNDIMSFKFEKKFDYVNIKSRLVFDVDKKKYLLDINDKNSIINKLENELSLKNKELLSYKNDSLNKINDLELQLKKLNEKIDNKNNDILKLKKRINHILNSKSWKMTRPCRKIGEFIKKIKDRIFRRGN